MGIFGEFASVAKEDFPIFPSQKLMFLKGESKKISCRMEWNPDFHISIYS
jgi:hypothetical protein